MKGAPLPLWRIPRVRYDRLVEAGLFGPDDRVELLDGLLIAREPQGGRHAVVVGLVRAALEKAFGRAYHMREEKPIALDPHSEPEPDVVVVAGRFRDYLHAHPSRPVLVVEVADTSLALDRLRKGRLYARAGIADYWVVNLVDEVLEVYRKPVKAAAAQREWRYDSVRRLRRTATVTPLAAPRARIRVSALLP
ncbi:MAG TPA: Uma2 family endonuclease [Methylomirabilota bacterium]|nr:Uma2 family endonuclease [Methylomirabilota bacterium]